MNGIRLIISIIYIIIFLGFQVLFGRNLSLFNTAFCLVYIGAFLYLPIKTPLSIVMLVALATGLVVDMFYDSAGMHACVSVLIAYLREFILRSTAPAGGYEDYTEISTSDLGLRWMLLFLTPLLFTHALVLFLIEFGGFSHFFTAFIEALFSTLYNLVLLLLIQYAFSWSGKRTV